MLRDLLQAQILNQQNLTAILRTQHRALLTQRARHVLWNHLPDYLLREHWNAILTMARQDDPYTALYQLTRQLTYRDERVAPEAIVFNPDQSTHTASVHQSVSDSALLLNRAYGHHDLEAHIELLNHETMIPEVAKRAINRLSDTNLSFTDSSGLNIRQVLALVDLAIHDDSKRQGSLEDAKKLFLQGLYEIQKGYNLNAHGIDDRSPRDRPICL